MSYKLKNISSIKKKKKETTTKKKNTFCQLYCTYG